MNTYTWKVNRVDCHDLEGKPDVLTTVHWTCEGTNGDVSVGHNGVTSLQAPKDNFISFNNLSENVVIEWVQAVLEDEADRHYNSQPEEDRGEKMGGVERVHLIVDGYINHITKPPTVEKQLPWSQE
jgi:F0F1-type ATP synthase gamma subunit